MKILVLGHQEHGKKTVVQILLDHRVLSTNDVCIGINSAEAFERNKSMFDVIFWVTRPGFPVDPKFNIQYDPHCMVPIVNFGTIQNIEDQVYKALTQPIYKAFV